MATLLPLLPGAASAPVRAGFELLRRRRRFGATSPAGLSSRSPLKAACRTLPSAVQPANSISATSSGSTQVQSLALRGAPLPPNGLLFVFSALSF